MNSRTTRSPRRLAALALSTAGLAVALWGSPDAIGASARAECANADAAPAALSAHQARKTIVCLLNRKRTHHGLPELGQDSRLQKAAQRHDELMRRQRCFAHQCTGEPDLESRLRAVGYISEGLSRWLYGENLAWGLYDYATPHSIVRGWMHSPPHRESILHADFREIGVGFVRGTPDKPHGLGATFATDFGLRIG